MLDTQSAALLRSPQQWNQHGKGSPPLSGLSGPTKRQYGQRNMDSGTRISNALRTRKDRSSDFKGEIFNSFSLSLEKRGKMNEETLQRCRAKISPWVREELRFSLENWIDVSVPAEEVSLGLGAQGHKERKFRFLVESEKRFHQFFPCLFSPDLRE